MNSNLKTTIKHNVVNYGLNCVVFLVIYIVLAIATQIVFELPDIWGTLLSSSIMLIASIYLYYKRKYKQEVVSFQAYRKVSGKSLLFWYSYTVVIAYACLVFFNWTSLHWVDKTMDTRGDAISDIPILIMIVYGILIAPLVEECMMRMFMYNQLKRSSHWIVSMIITSAVFALLHGTISHMIFATIFALSLTLAYEYTRNILVPIFGHMSYNMLSLFIPTTSYPSNNIYVLVMFIFVILSLIISTVGLNYKMKEIQYRDM